MPRKQNDEGAAPASTASAMITPLDIQQKEFQVSRLGGYRMRDVDEFLDELTDAMSAVLAENERLRAGASSSPIVGSPDLDEVARQADEIIQRARDEAARIVADANERAASIAGEVASGSVDAADRAAVDAFISRERAFLQSLAALVQEHAGGVKDMARDVRRRSAPPGTMASSTASSAGAGLTPAPSFDAPPLPAATPAAAPSPPSTGASAPSRQPAVPPAGPEPSVPSGDTSVPSDADATRRITPVPPADEPIVVTDPEPARSRRDDEGRDESLRELFWGEES